MVEKVFPAFRLFILQLAKAPAKTVLFEDRLFAPTMFVKPVRERVFLRGQVRPEGLEKDLAHGTGQVDKPDATRAQFEVLFVQLNSLPILPFPRHQSAMAFQIIIFLTEAQNTSPTLKIINVFSAKIN